METMTEVTKAIQLAELGFGTAATKLQEKTALKRKLALAYEHFRFVRKEKMDSFIKKLHEQTYNKKTGQYKTLSLTSVQEYTEIPPEHVLTSFSAAKEIKCFDEFRIAHVVDVKDPILFGQIKGCSDYFFIDQWDNDVKIEDILMPNEG